MSLESFVNGWEEFRCHPGLHHVTERTDEDTLTDELGVKVDGEKDDPRLTASVLQEIGGIYAIENGHRNVADDNIRLQAHASLEHIPSVSDSCDHREIRAEQMLRHLHKTWVVVCQKYG